jgi:hypothetical protein
MATFRRSSDKAAIQSAHAVEAFAAAHDAHRAVDRVRGDLAVLDGFDGQVVSAMRAIATGPDLRE